MDEELKINGSIVKLMKAPCNAKYGTSIVITESEWEYVDLWLTRTRGINNDAKLYWLQAKSFYNASNVLPIESKPLTAYYCILNAAKTLLCCNNVKMDNIGHGVSCNRNQNNRDILNEEIIFNGAGVLNELSKYLGEDTSKVAYSAKNLLYNIPYVHSAFCNTFTKHKQLFIPISNIEFYKCNNNEVKLKFSLSSKYNSSAYLNDLPKIFENGQYLSEKENACVVCLKNGMKWDIHSSLEIRQNDLSKLHAKIRRHLYCISRSSKFWYLKRANASAAINRSSLTLTFGVMHWMSELVRYNPKKFEKLMQTKANWLVNEFINNALDQFVNEISCEITHLDIMRSI